MEIHIFKDEKDLTSFINEAEQNQIFDIQAEKSSIWNYNANKQVGQYATLVPAQNNPSNQLAVNSFYNNAHQNLQQTSYNLPWQVNQERAAKEYINIIEEKNRVMSILKEAKANENETIIYDEVAKIQYEFYQYPLFGNKPMFLPKDIRNLSFQLLPELAYLIAGTRFTPAIALLASCVEVAIACAGNVKIQCDQNWSEATSIMILPIAPSATRKSVVVERAQKPIFAFLKEINKDVLRNEQIKGFMENVLKQEEKLLLNKAHSKLKQATSHKEKYEVLKCCAENAVEELSVVPQKYSILLNRSTYVALIKHFKKNNEQGGAITAEGDVAISFLLDKKNDPSFFNKLFNQEAYTYTTAYKEFVLSKPIFSFFSFIQPNIAKKLYTNQNLREAGASARILPYFEPLWGISACAVDEDSINEGIFNKKILSIMERYHNVKSKKQYVATLTPEAYKIVKDFEAKLVYSVIPNAHPDSHACLRKLHGYAVRFAWAIHLLYTDNFHETPISLESMNMAIDLCYTLLPHIEYAYNPTGLEAEEIANLIIEFFQKVDLNLGTLTYGYTDSRTIQQRIHKNSKQTKHGLEKLQDLGYVRIIDVGRVKNIVVPHPLLLGGQKKISLGGYIPKVNF